MGLNLNRIMAKYIKEMSEFDALMETSKTKLVVIDFTATWCPPCQMIKPHFEQLSTEITSVVFIKVDVDDAKEISEKCSIRAMPTFQFIKDGEKVDELCGADLAKLKALIAKNQ